MAISISTKDYVKGQEVEIDGMKWQFTAPGAGATLDLSRISRKSAEIEKRSKDGVLSPEDQQEQLELIGEVLKFYNTVFKDGTKDNKHVAKWLNETPFDAISAIVQDIQKGE